MKIIRKDLLIDQKKIQQAYIEKEILNTVSAGSSFSSLIV
jgi:hypothetical protein